MNSYREKKERARVLYSLGMVFGATALVILISVLFNLFKFEDFTDYNGPVKITFGSPDSLIEESVVTEIPEPEPEPEPEPIIEEYVEPEPEVQPVKDVEPVVDVKPEPKPEITPEPKPKPKVEPKVVEPPKPIVQKGSESGNSHETSFESSSSNIGRRAYFPISQFMPLPKKISLDLYALIDGDITGMDEENYNKSLIEKYYWKTTNGYTLSNSIPLQARPDLWAIIEQAGYDVKKPEYKKGKNLKTVVIVFEINSNSKGLNAIKSAVIDSSSGDKAIDKAVLYGFKQSTYSNATSDSVKGRFKYSFK